MAKVGLRKVDSKAAFLKTQHHTLSAYPIGVLPKQRTFGKFLEKAREATGMLQAGEDEKKD